MCLQYYLASHSYCIDVVGFCVTAFSMEFAYVKSFRWNEGPSIKNICRKGMGFRLNADRRGGFGIYRGLQCRIISRLKDGRIVLRTVFSI